MTAISQTSPAHQSYIKPRKKLGEALIDQGLIKPHELEVALLQQKQHPNKKLGRILVENWFVTDIELYDILLEENHFDGITDEVCMTPSCPVDVLEELSAIILMEAKEVVFYSTMGNRIEAEAKLRKHYRKARLVHRTTSMDLISETLTKLKTNRTRQQSDIGGLLEKAIAMGVSDFKLMLVSDTYFVQGRYLGDLSMIQSGSAEEYHKLMSKLKELSGIDTSDKLHPGDGGFTYEYNGVKIDLRVATIPCEGGNTATVRILDPSNLVTKLKYLGITDLKEWVKAINRPDGLIFIVGPTGSGKTTSLNTSIRELDRLENSILTAENPIEYRIPFVHQMQINELDNLNFVDAVRAFLRSDPDYIVVGEVRDEETGSIVIRAGESAHTVLGTLHCQTIKSVVGRLRTIGIRPEQYKDLLRGVLAQKLIKVACRTCFGEKIVNDEECADCGGLGHIDRTTVSECAYIHDETDFQRLLDGEIWWATMCEDAIGKIFSRVTTRKYVIDEFREEATRILARIDNGDLALKEKIVAHAAKGDLLREGVGSMLEKGEGPDAIENAYGEVGLYILSNNLYVKPLNSSFLAGGR
ncbi:ATPase, T2SS/T4P/T4SS family [Marinomonas sp. TI.3.20]|uniref:GspE/PulE family protein n=1 Tax=Marinomonas sp. TI.3.20 TaxID=3121296 RepID=UPI00311F62D9